MPYHARTKRREQRQPLSEKNQPSTTSDVSVLATPIVNDVSVGQKTIAAGTTV